MLRLVFGLFVLFAFTSCHRDPPPIGPLIVAAPDLAKAFRDHPQAAKDAYAGRTVLILVSGHVRRDNEVCWHLASPDTPAVLVCVCDELPAVLPRSVWLTGTCVGRIEDGEKREFSGFTFNVRIVGCRVAEPPK